VLNRDAEVVYAWKAESDTPFGRPGAHFFTAPSHLMPFIHIHSHIHSHTPTRSDPDFLVLAVTKSLAGMTSAALAAQMEGATYMDKAAWMARSNKL
jgi:hypothetical protein